MLEMILEYFVGVYDDIACRLSPKRRAVREREARNDPFNRMFSLMLRDMQLVNIQLELWQLERIKKLEKEIEKFKRDQEITQKEDQEKNIEFWEKTLCKMKEEINEEEIIKIKEIIREIEIEKKGKKDLSENFLENKRFSWPR